MADKPPGTATLEGKPKDPGYRIRIVGLSRAMPELWIVFAAKFLGSAAYSVMNSTFVLWLSYDLGYSDEKALGMVAGWSFFLTAVTLLVGSLTDAIGLRKAFLLGAWICVLARLVITISTVQWLALIGGMLPLAVGEALGTPVVVAAVRRYSTTAQRSIAFSLSYVFMNLGFLFAGEVFDYIRRNVGDVQGRFTVPLFGIELTTYRTLFLASLLLQLILLPLLYCLRKGAEATDEGVRFHPDVPKYPGETTWNAIRFAARDTLLETVRLFGRLCRQPGFYRLLAFLLLIAFVKLIFMQMSYVYPTFGVRELGKGSPLGRLWSVTNSGLIVVLVPVVGVLTQRFSAYRMVTLGCAISAASVFVMALPTAWFEGVAAGPVGHWIGHHYLRLEGSVNPWYVMIFLYVILLSVGEAFYSPRVYEYAAAIAPKGQEASYGALSYVPFFLAKLIVGTSSGFLLGRYCPEDGPRNSQTMWLVIAMFTTVAPLGLILLRRYIRVREAGRDG